MKEPVEASPAGGDGATLEALLLRYLDGVDSGQPPDLSELCARRPELLPKLRKLVALNAGLFEEEREDSARDPLTGRTLGGRYELLYKLGVGGMGVVYAARDTKLGREVAVKIVEDIFQSDPGRLERFRREATTLAALENPHIVAVHDLDADSDPPYLVMDRVAGFDLGVLLDVVAEDVEAGVLPETTSITRAASTLAGVGEERLDPSFRRPWPEFVARLGVQMCRALAAAHEAGVVHRDVKPTNFMLDASGRLRLLDFGIARRDADPGLTRTHATVGTPLFMAPEQVRGDATGPGADVYSVGATLYLLLALQPPFVGTMRELENRILYEEPLPPRQVRGGLSRDLEAVCLKALQKAPSKRYGSANGVAEDLERFLRYESVRARPQILPAPLRSLVATWRRYRPAWPALAAIAAVVVLAVVFGSQLLADRTVGIRTALNEAVRSIPPTVGLWGTKEERARVAEQELRLLGEILALEPGHVEARFLHWRISAEHGIGAPQQDRASLVRSLGEDVLARYAAAFESLRARDEKPDGIATALAGLGAAPEDADTRLLWHRLHVTSLVMTGRIAEAERGLDRVEADLPEGVDATAFTKFCRGMLMMARQNYDGALDDLLVSWKLAPVHPATLLALARVRFHKRDLDLAESRVREALALSSSHFNKHELLVRILRTRHEFSEAEIAIEQIPGRFPHERSLALGNLRVDQAMLAVDEAEHTRLLSEAEAAFREAQAVGDDNPRLRAKARRNVRTVRAILERDLATIVGRLKELPLSAPLLVHVGSQLLERRTGREYGEVLLLQSLAVSPAQPQVARKVANALAEHSPALACRVLIEHLRPDRKRDGDDALIRRLLRACSARDRRSLVRLFRQVGLVE